MAGGNVASGMDQKAHENTYAGFISLFKFGTLASLAVAAFVVYLLV